jgi:CBS-domain-containing membrane protein
MANPVYRHLHSLAVSDIIKPGPVITLKTTDWVEKAIKILSENKILSVPVIDGSKDKIGCVGLVDILDIVHYIDKVAPEDDALNSDTLKSLEVAGRAIAMEEVGWIISK